MFETSTPDVLEDAIPWNHTSLWSVDEERERLWSQNLVHWHQTTMHHDDSLNHLYHIWWFYSDGEFCSTERFSCAWKPTTKALSRVKAAMHSSVMPWPEVQSQSSYPNCLFLSYYLFLPKRYIPQHQITLSHLNQLGGSVPTSLPVFLHLCHSSAVDATHPLKAFTPRHPGVFAPSPEGR